MKNVYPSPIEIISKGKATITIYNDEWKIFRCPGFACSLCQAGCNVLKNKRSIPADVRKWAINQGGY